MNEKRCTGCLVTFPLDQFWCDRRTTDGRQSRCKTCRYEYYKMWRSTAHGRELRRQHERKRWVSNREELRARARTKYRKSPVEYARRTKVRMQTKRGKAKQAIANRVVSGTIKKPTRCPSCGTATPPHRMHAHHVDYSRPLDVIWMCSVCHGIVHRQSE